MLVFEQKYLKGVLWVRVDPQVCLKMVLGSSVWN